MLPIRRRSRRRNCAGARLGPRTECPVGQHQVDAAAGLAEDVSDGPDLCVRSGLAHLHDGRSDFEGQALEVHQGAVGATGRILPGGGTVAGRSRRVPSLIGQPEDSPTFCCVRRDQALVFHGLEGGVDGSGARAPHTTAAFGELGDDLVAVHGLLGQEGEDGGTDVTTSHPGSASEHRSAEPGPEASVAAEAGRVAGAATPPPATAAAAGVTAEAVTGTPAPTGGSRSSVVPVGNDLNFCDLAC